jgi:uncharacterized protein (TIGR03067 family)
MTRAIDEFQGKWKVVSLNFDGATFDAGILENALLEIRGEHFIAKGMGAVYEERIEVDSSADPKRFAMKFELGPEAGNTNFGIYRFGENQLEICIATLSDAPPTDFATSPGDGSWA